MLPSWLAQVFPLGSHGSAGFPDPSPDCAVSLTGLGAAIGYVVSHVFILSPLVLQSSENWMLKRKKLSCFAFIVCVISSTSRSSLLMIVD